jgi:hypothetical protein
VRFNPVEGPGLALPDEQRFAVSVHSYGGFPVSNWQILGGRLTSYNGRPVGGVLLTRAGGAGSGSVVGGMVRDLNFRDFGLRGLVAGVSQAAAAVVTTDQAHRLASGSTVFLRGVAGTIAVNGGPHTVTVLSANTFSIPVDTSASPAFVATRTGVWCQTDPDRDIDYTTSSASDLRELRFDALPGTNSGGHVTQATSKTTAVELNRMTGLITTHNANLAAGAAVILPLNNVWVEQGDIVVLNHDSSIGGTTGAYGLTARADTAYAAITIRNLTAGDLAEAVAIRFSILKTAG